MTPNTVHLTRAHYLEEKRRILLEFSNSKAKGTKSYSFFPSFFLEKKMPLKELSSILSNYSPQKFKVREKPNSFQVTASTFKDLKCLANLCLGAFAQRPSIIEPERQFLIAQDWSYYDSFCFFEGSPVKSNREVFPDVKVESLAESLPETMQQLLSYDRKTADSLTEGIALSKLLKLPIESVPATSFLRMETLAENIFFNNCMPAPRDNPVKLPAEQAQLAKPTDGIEMDFSQLWPLLLTRPFYNLGTDSIDCSCCRPKSVFESNILPNSTIVGSFLSEAFYFESIVPGYALEFHTTAPNKENRLRLRREFCLNYIPVGPFQRGQCTELMFCDALNLCNKGKLELKDEAKLHWFCLKKESFLSAELRKLNRRIVALSKQLAAEEKTALQKHNLLAGKSLSNDFNFLFKQALCNATKQIYCSIPLHLASPKSSFFSEAFASAVEAVKASTLHRFSELLKEHNGRMIHTAGKTAVVRTEQPMLLAKEFAEREKIPLLIPLVKRPAHKGHQNHF